jgi:hypothetical protein
MPSFVKGGAAKTPFGKNVYLRSTVGCKFESYTLAKDTVPIEMIDGSPQKIMQPGTVLAKITSGPDSGKVGPFQAAGTAEVQTITPTTVTAGTFTLTIVQPTTGVSRTTAPIAWNATQATVLAALVALDNVEPGDLQMGGAATINAGAVTVTFFGNFIGNPAQMTVDNTNLTGTLAITTSTPGVAGAVDGRQTTANIVGLCDTWLPWQLLEHDENVGAMYIGTAVQGWCFELNAAGARIALTNTTADAMRSTKGLDVTFK